MKIEIKNRITGGIIFEYNSDNNTIKKTVEKAVYLGIVLDYAELNYAELNGAELNGAELNGAELNYAELNGAKLANAELNGAKLANAALNHAELTGAELNYAKLNHAELTGAELNYANLNCAKLNYAKLNYAELTGATLTGAELNGAELNHVQLTYAKGNLRQIKNISVELWDVVYTRTHMAIGCKQFTMSEWKTISDEDINNLDKGALAWWKKWKAFIFLAINLSFMEYKND